LNAHGRGTIFSRGGGRRKETVRSGRKKKRPGVIAQNNYLPKEKELPKKKNWGSTNGTGIRISKEECKRVRRLGARRCRRKEGYLPLVEGIPRRRSLKPNKGYSTPTNERSVSRRASSRRRRKGISSSRNKKKKGQRERLDQKRKGSGPKLRPQGENRLEKGRSGWSPLRGRVRKACRL